MLIEIKMYRIQFKNQCAPLVWWKQPANAEKTKEDFYVLKCCKAIHRDFFIEFLLHNFFEDDVKILG